MYIQKLALSKKTVFSVDDLRLLWGVENSAYLKTVIFRLVKRKVLIRIIRGLYGLDQEYNRFELANKIKIPSYVSLETVLSEENIIFRPREKTITSVSTNTISKQVENREYRYQKIADRIFLNPKGIIYKNTIVLATPERALCDQVYLFSGYRVDNIRPLDKEKLIDMARMYNKRVLREIKKIIHK